MAGTYNMNIYNNITQADQASVLADHQIWYVPRSPIRLTASSRVNTFLLIFVTICDAQIRPSKCNEAVSVWDPLYLLQNNVSHQNMFVTRWGRASRTECISCIKCHTLQYHYQADIQWQLLTDIQLDIRVPSSWRSPCMSKVKYFSELIPSTCLSAHCWSTPLHLTF